MGRLVRRFVLLLALSALAGSGWAQLPADVVKAGLVFNIVKFTEWPASRLAPGEPLHLCSTGTRDATLVALDSLQDKVVLGHSVQLRVFPLRDSFRGCHVLVLGGIDPAVLPDVLRQAHSVGALTASDQPGFVEAGGIVGLVTEGNHVRFDINLDSTYKADVRISLQVLRFARSVRKTAP